MLKKFALSPLAALFCLVLPAHAQPTTGGKAGDVGRAEILQQMVGCRNAPTDAAQLACYRQATDTLVKAEAAGDIVLVDRADARKVRRQAFGLSLPSMSLFEKGATEQELSTVTGQVRTARQDTTGRWTVQLDSGDTWVQLETTPLRNAPKAGMPVTITRAALGSYRMKIADQTSLRAKRIE